MKRLFFALCYRTGLTRFIAWCNRRRVKILCYHSITMLPELMPDDENKQHLPQRLFISQLEHLRKHYRVISLADYLTARSKGQRLAPYSVILTFDDGFRNFLTVAAPLLAERSFPATNFIVTNLTSEADNSQQPCDWMLADDDSHLSWSEIESLAHSQAVDFGSHTFSHPRLTEISLAEAERELQKSFAEIVEHLKYEAVPLAYPHNQTSRALGKLAASLGYSCALTANLGQNDMDSDLFSLSRTVIAADDEVATFAARVSGLTWWADRLRALRPSAIASRLTRRPSRRPYSITKELDYSE